VDNFYQAILRSFRTTGDWDIADSALQSIRISDAEMGKYSTVVWHSDVRQSPPMYQDTTELREYLQQGGRLLVSGWKLSASFNSTTAAVVTYPSTSFVPLYLKMDSTQLSGVLAQDFKTAQAALAGYADATVDSVKIPTYGGALVNTDVTLLPYAGPNVQTLFTHRGRVPGSLLEGKPVAWRYLGADFKVVVFDFPLFYMRQVEAQAALQRALLDVGETPLSVEQTSAVAPEVFELAQSFPNPFNPTTTIEYRIPKEELVTLKVYNLVGQEVATLVNEKLSAGSYKSVFDTSRLRDGIASGVFFYRLTAGAFVKTKKMILIR
jgi:hypothetical protein